MTNNEETDCWLLWELDRATGHMYLRSVCTAESKAQFYVRALLRLAEEQGQLRPELIVEKTKTNHCYGRIER